MFLYWNPFSVTVQLLHPLARALPHWETTAESVVSRLEEIKSAVRNNCRRLLLVLQAHMVYGKTRATTLG
jgi:hypothetical protein